MATSSEVVEKLSAAAGIRQVTLGHTARLLREASGDLWPRSGKGGGKSARRVEPRHYAYLILAMAAVQPSDAPSTVAKLGAAQWVKKRQAAGTATTVRLLSARALLAADGRRTSGLTLHRMLERMITTVASSKDAVLEGRRRGWTLWLNSDAGSARTSWIDSDGTEHSEQYVPSQPPLIEFAGQRSQTLVERLIKIPFGLVAVAAEVCATTMAQNRADEAALLGKIPNKGLGNKQGRRRVQSPRAPDRGQPHSRLTKGRGTPKK